MYVNLYQCNMNLSIIKFIQQNKKIYCIFGYLFTHKIHQLIILAVIFLLSIYYQDFISIYYQRQFVERMNQNNKSKQGPKKREIIQDLSQDQDNKTKLAGKNNRLQNSLLTLTEKFVNLIQSSPNRTLDISEAAKKLNVQKRRIYDITSVLEQIGYAEKIKKNVIRWTGQQNQQNDKQQMQNCIQQLQVIMEQKRKVQQYINEIKQQINRDYIENINFNRNAYLTHQQLGQIAKIFTSENPDKQLILLSGPKGTKMELSEQPNGRSFLKFQALNSQELQVHVIEPKKKQKVASRKG